MTFAEDKVVGAAAVRRRSEAVNLLRTRPRVDDGQVWVTVFVLQCPELARTGIQL